VTVLVAQSPYEGVPAAIAKIVAGWSGRRVALIVESHGDFEQALFLHRRIVCAALVRKLMRLTASLVLPQADVLRSISQATTAQLHRWRPDAPVVQFMAWTDIDVFFEAGRHRAADSAQVILFSGVLVPAKGVIYLMNAFALLAAEYPEARLVLIGKPHDPEYVAALQRRLTELDLRSRITFVPHLAQLELAQWMAQALVFVLPSLSEGLGRVVIEAMAAGTPVIGSAVGGIPDLIQAGQNGWLVPPADERALAQQLRWVLEHPAQTRQMGQQAAAFARQFFSEAGYVAGYAKLFTAATAPVQSSEGTT